METLICSAYGHCFVGAWTEPKKWQLGGNCYQANYYHHHYYCCAQGWKDYTRGWMDSGLGARVLSLSPSHPLPISSSSSSSSSSPSSFTISGVGGTALVGIFNNNNNNNNNSNSNNKGNVDALVFHNLLEMIPLVESLMDQRGLYNRSFPRHASLVYTHTPTKDRPLNKPLENGSKSWLGRSTSGGKLRPGELLFWDEDVDPDEGRDEDMSVLSLSTEHQVTEGYNKQPEFWIEGEETKKYNSVEEEMMPALSSPTTTTTEDEASQAELANKEELLQLESQVKELERKIEEREKQLKSKVSVQEIHELQALAHRLGKELSKKDHEIQDLNRGLLTKQNELGDLHTHLQKVEEKARKASKKASEAEQEMLGLRCQVTALLFQLELILHTYAVSEFRGNLSMASTITKSDREEKEPRSKTNGEVEDEEIENARRMYMAAVIAAEKNPKGELLTLVAVSRAQLHSFLV